MDKKEPEHVVVGLDPGTSSCGWAVTHCDENGNYAISKYKHKDMWGARKFEEGETAKDRRTYRESRRRIRRRNIRISILNSLFEKTINGVDHSFFYRLQESGLCAEDKKKSDSKYSLFNDANYTDEDYYKEYPTVYHLISDLIHTDEKKDIRLYYLAIHHLMKHRGHFLYGSSLSENNITVENAINDLSNYLAEFDINFTPEDRNTFVSVLTATDIKKSDKKKQLKTAYGKIEKNDTVDVSELIALIGGSSVQAYKLFCDPSLKDNVSKSIELGTITDEELSTLETTLQDNQFEILSLAKNIFDVSKLNNILHGREYLSDAKIDLYNKNNDDLKHLKKWVRTNISNEYYNIFSNTDIKNNFNAYANGNSIHKCSQSDMCKFLAKKVAKMKESEDEQDRDLYNQISEGTFFTKLKSGDNAVVPYQLKLKELKAVLKSAERFYPFLSTKDETGLTASEKIILTFQFKIPYFVGPTGKGAKNGWIVRDFDSDLKPWNFSDNVDEQKTAEQFIVRMLNTCTYTGEPVLPAKSILYSKFCVLNEINNLKVDGNYISVTTKQHIYNDLFLNSKSSVTKNKIKKYLIKNKETVNGNPVTEDSVITGVTDTLKSNMQSYHDFKNILESTNDEAMVEDIILHITIYGNQKNLLKTWLKENTPLSDGEIKTVSTKNYNGWGKLSRYFLTEIYQEDKDGVLSNVIDTMWNTNNNLNMVLSKEYSFGKQAEEHLHSLSGDQNHSVSEMIDQYNISPSCKKGVLEAMKVVKDLQRIDSIKIDTICIEVPRENDPDAKGIETVNRRKTLLNAYKAFKKNDSKSYKEYDGDYFVNLLNDENKITDSLLRQNRYYLWFSQLGRDMYTGERIDFSKITTSDYNRDHIYPRSKVKDDSVHNNLVLVNTGDNHDKENVYPINPKIQEKMQPFWKMLFKNKMINSTKFERLTRNTPLTDDELASFVNRQLTTTAQISKALAMVIQEKYPDIHVIYSSAANVSEFRQEFGLTKFRDVNDFHHAKDAFLNAVVGSVWNTRFNKNFFKNIGKENYSIKPSVIFRSMNTTYQKNGNTKYVWKSGEEGSIRSIQHIMKQNTPIVTVATHEGTGKIADTNIVGKNSINTPSMYLPVKKELPVEKYGGLKNIKAAYFAIIEYTGKDEKTIKKIVPVPIYMKSVYEENPEQYFRENGYENCRVLYQRIPMQTLMIINGRRYRIVGRSGDGIIYNNDYQLMLNDKESAYLKDCQKFVSRNKSKAYTTQAERDKGINHADDIVPTTYDHVTKEDNLKMLKVMMRLLIFSPYADFLKTLSKKIVNDDYLDEFEKMNVYDQCDKLLDLLKAFQCNAAMPSDSKGRIRMSSDITNENISVINESPTGLLV